MINLLGISILLSLIAIKTILSNPPTADFFGGTVLELSVVPVSQMLLTNESGDTEDPSSAFKRSYSSASESVMSPNSSMDSMHFQKGFENVASPNASTDSTNYRRRLGETSLVSMDSLSGENQTTRYPDILDPEELSFGYSQKSRNSSTSSEGDSISSGMFRRDVQSSIALSTVTECPTTQIQSGEFILGNTTTI